MKMIVLSPTVFLATEAVVVAFLSEAPSQTLITYDEEKAEVSRDSLAALAAPVGPLPGQQF